MNHGKYNLAYRLRTFTAGASFLACLVACVVAGGCRSSRNMVQESTTVEHSEFNTSEENKSVHSEADDSIYQREAISGSSGERGRIDIERDSAGRPIVILWTFNSNFLSENYSDTFRKNLFTFRGSSGSAQSSGAVDSVTEKKEETQEEINASISLDSLIGSGLLSLVIMYVVYVLIADHLWPWIKNRKR